MNLKRNPKIDVLELAQHLKAGNFEKNPATKFDELFSFPFKISVSMKKILQEILAMKEISYVQKSYNRKLDGLRETLVDEFKILNIKTVRLGYDKYTFMSKKEYVYVIFFDHIATITQNSTQSNISLIDENYYDAILKLSKNINEYYDTSIILTGDRKEDKTNIKILKKDFDLLDKKSYFTTGDTNIFVEDVLKNLNNEAPVERVYYWANY